MLTQFAPVLRPNQYLTLTVRDEQGKVLTTSFFNYRPNFGNDNWAEYEFNNKGVAAFYEDVYYSDWNKVLEAFTTPNVDTKVCLWGGTFAAAIVKDPKEGYPKVFFFMGYTMDTEADIADIQFFMQHGAHLAPEEYKLTKWFDPETLEGTWVEIDSLKVIFG